MRLQIALHLSNKTLCLWIAALCAHYHILTTRVVGLLEGLKCRIPASAAGRGIFIYILVALRITVLLPHELF